MLSVVDGSVIVNGVDVTRRPPKMVLEGVTDFDIFINGQKVHRVQTTTTAAAAEEKDASAASLPVTKVEPNRPIRVELRVQQATNIVTSESHVHVAGDVNGSVSTATGTITVGHDVQQNINTMSGSVTVQGSIAGNATTMSGSIQAETVRGSASSMSGSVRRPTEFHPLSRAIKHRRT